MKDPRSKNKEEQKQQNRQRQPAPTSFGGRFPGTTELSVISEGSYRTSQDGTSYAAASSIDDGSSTGLSMTEEEKWAFSNYYDPDDETRPKSKLTASAIASNSQILGMDLTTTDLEYDDDDEEDDDNMDDLADERNMVATQPQTSGPVVPISKHLDKGNKSTPPREQQQRAAQKNRDNSDARQSWCSWFSATPLWLRLAVLLCSLVVLVSVAVGVAAALAKKDDNEEDPTPQEEDNEFIQYRPEQLIQSTPSPSPGLRG